MEVYADILIFENFIVNLFLLYLTSQTLRTKYSIKRFIIPSLIGALYCIVVLFDFLSFLNNLPIKILVSFLMTFLVFRKREILFLIKSSIVYIIYSMVLAGVCVFVDISKETTFSLNYQVVNFSYKYLLLSLMIIYLFSSRINTFVQDRKSMNKYIYDIEILDNNFKAKMRAFLDTGNELREPATNLPVIIIEENVLKDYRLENKDTFKIPYAAVNGHKGELQGFKPLGVKISYDDNNIQFREVIVCLCKERLSNTDDYVALLSRGLI
ncbi:sigma-E processing peptidase SpoIIGA [Clostridium hydrogeniformans]|uniref:sigma-E processing peptidase SpoIIGA n=1 Tax=Clostridium hydrogeniformans TaxID=349933 RepID=UPI000483CF38|nr:sigma-E processing peptidase SpoIIGA [Clostridium hydrogeniformans]